MRERQNGEKWKEGTTEQRNEDNKDTNSALFKNLVKTSVVVGVSTMIAVHEIKNHKQGALPRPSQGFREWLLPGLDLRH